MPMQEFMQDALNWVSKKLFTNKTKNPVNGLSRDQLSEIKSIPKIVSHSIHYFSLFLTVHQMELHTILEFQLFKSIKNPSSHQEFQWTHRDLPKITHSMHKIHWKTTIMTEKSRVRIQGYYNPKISIKHVLLQCSEWQPLVFKS